MKKIILLFVALCLALPVTTFAQEDDRTKVIIDNDFCGDPDGLFQLVHHLYCKQTKILAIIGANEYEGKSMSTDASKGQATLSVEKVNELLSVMDMKGSIRVVKGSEHALMDASKAQESEGARVIVEEARKATYEDPIFIACGGSLTNVASALLLDPSIEDKIILVWIGGQEYPEIGSYAPQEIAPLNGTPDVEYNLGMSIPAAQVVFNKSKIRIWQIPRDVYRQCLFTFDEIKVKVAPYGKVGDYLLHSLDHLREWGNMEAYPLGDSPLVLLTSLRSFYEPAPSSSSYKYMVRPYICDDGTYRINHDGGLIKVFTQIDSRIMFEDFQCKLMLYAK